MSWTYDAALPTTKDQVRFLVQDTNSAKQLFQDEEIDWTVTQAANIYMAAAELCDMLTARSGGVKGKRISDLAIQYDPGFYVILGGQMRARGFGHQIPYAGGISGGGKLSQQQDTDATKPSVVRNLEENPAAPSPSQPSANPLTSI